MTRVERGTVDDYTSPLDGMSVLSRRELERDALGRVTSALVRDGEVEILRTQYGYDALGRTECVTVRMNSAAFGSGLPACTPGPTGSEGPDRITRTSWNEIGQVTAVTVATGTPDQVDYSRTTAFSANGLPLNVLDANGNVTSYSYDGFDPGGQRPLPEPLGRGQLGQRLCAVRL